MLEKKKKNKLITDLSGGHTNHKQWESRPQHRGGGLQQSGLIRKSQGAFHLSRFLILSKSTVSQLVFQAPESALQTQYRGPLFPTEHNQHLMSTLWCNIAVCTLSVTDKDWMCPVVMHYLPSGTYFHRPDIPPTSGTPLRRLPIIRKCNHYEFPPCFFIGFILLLI